jgi:hypothetical protein
MDLGVALKLLRHCGNSLGTNRLDDDQSYANTACPPSEAPNSLSSYILATQKTPVRCVQGFPCPLPKGTYLFDDPGRLLDLDDAFPGARPDLSDALHHFPCEVEQWLGLR